MRESGVTEDVRDVKRGYRTETFLYAYFGNTVSGYRSPHMRCGTSDLTVLQTKAYGAFLETRATNSSNRERKSFRMGDVFILL